MSAIPTPQESVEDLRDRRYEQGFQAAMRVVLAAIVNRLPEGDAQRWQLERGQAVVALRDVCEDFGDNDWPDDLHLADVIEKHLARRLHEGRRPVSAIPTPGPWEIQWLKFNADIVSPNGFKIAHVIVTPDAETEANVALIAAAPDLLATLKQCIGWIDPEEHGLVNYEDARRDLALAEAAIAKAEGR